MKGRFKPKNPQKYKGDPTEIIYRSSYEFKFFRYIDDSDDIEWWSSEELAIPYKSPVDGKYHRYFPDVILKKTDGEILVIEIKPEHQTIEPVMNNKKTKKRFIREVIEWGKNTSKWNAAIKYCKKREWKFLILTEKNLGIPVNENRTSRKRY